MLLMISSAVSSTVLSGFESRLPTVLLVFVPMLMGTGGNSGTQSSVTVIRAISNGELKFRDTPRVLMKEACVGILTGITLFAIAYLKVFFIDGRLFGNSEVDARVALAVSASVGITVFVSKTVGALLPQLAKKLGLDPAVMASPFITARAGI